jgi:hypothetical protein
MRQALTMDVLATDLADYLVRKGVSVHITDVQAPLILNKKDPVPRDTSHFG